MANLGIGMLNRPNKVQWKGSRVHIYNGFPHHNHKFPHFCQCLEDCCQHPEKGCVCKNCPCRNGNYVHGQSYNGPDQRDTEREYNDDSE